MTGSRVRAWTDDEIGWLLDHEHLTARQAGEELDRGMQSVQHMRTKLRRGGAPSDRWWTPTDVEVVRSTPHLTARQVANHLGRSITLVEGKRHDLTKSEGLTFGKGERKNPNEVGKRRLIAKTCLGCGLLLDASWYSKSNDGHGQMKNWKPRCNRCHHGEAAPKPQRSTFAKDGGQSARTTYAKLQAVTLERASRHGETWLDQDHEILRDPDLTAFEKAIQLGRSYAATRRAVQENGYTSRVGRADPVKGQWVIDNPNTGAISQELAEAV